MGAGEQYLHQRNDKLHQTAEVEKAAGKKRRAEKRAAAENAEEVKITNYQKPEEKIKAYTERLQKILQPHRVEKESEEKERNWILDRGSRNARILKSQMEKEGKYEELGIVINPENIENAYWERQKRLRVREGRARDLPRDEGGNRYIPEAVKKQEVDRIQADQKSTFNMWLNYMGSKHSDYIPSWALVWALEGVKNSENRYNEETGELNTRTKHTVNPYPKLNSKAFALATEAIRKNVEDGEITEENTELKKAIETAEFRNVYGRYLKEVTAKSPETLENIEGSWTVYKQKRAGKKLTNDLRGKNTGWFVDGMNMLLPYLQAGDLHVYYSQDEEGRETVPRLAIHVLKTGKIGQIRGVDKGKHIDPYIGPVLDAKLAEFGEKAKTYRKVQADVRRLNRIAHMHERGLTLDADDLEFLYETRRWIRTYDRQNMVGVRSNRWPGPQKWTRTYARRDTRIEKIKAERDRIKDYNAIFRQRGEVYEKNVAVGVYQSAEGLELPREIRGSLDLRGLQSAKGLNLPETIGGSLDLSGLENADGLTLPSEINGDLDLRGLQSAEGLKFPETIGGSLILKHLRDAGDVEMPRKVHGNLDLSWLQNPDGLELPETIGGKLDLGLLRNAEGLIFPREVWGYLNLRFLESAEGLNLPETIGGHLNLRELRDAGGLEMPRKVHGSLDLSRLQNPDGLKLPETIDGDLFLRNLKNAEGLKFPREVRGRLNLFNLESAEGLHLPETIDGDLILRSLGNADGLELPQQVNGILDLSGLESADGIRGLENFEKTITFGPDIEYVPREVLNTCDIEFPLLTPKERRSKMQELYRECDRREYQEDKQRLEEMRSQLQINKQRALGKQFLEQIRARLIYHRFRFVHLFCKPLVRKIRFRLIGKRKK